MAPTERLLKDRAHPRLNMVNCQLRPNGVVEERLIRAFESTPMEEFVPPAIQSLVYSDADLSLTPDYPFKRWLMAPLTLGLLLQLAAIKPSDKVLILGCGTGYSLALVAQLAACVVGLECDGDLADQARAYVEGHGLAHVKVIKGALSIGYPKDAPFDVILIEGGVDKIPSIFIQQLESQKGRLVAVVKERAHDRQINLGKGTLITRSGKTFKRVSKFEVSCPDLAEFVSSKEFRL